MGPALALTHVTQLQFAPACCRFSSFLSSRVITFFFFSDMANKRSWDAKKDGVDLSPQAAFGANRGAAAVLCNEDGELTPRLVQVLEVGFGKAVGLASG